MGSHAYFSPSGAHRWMACAGSLALEAGKPDTSSAFADEGTAAHFLAAEVLRRPEDTAHMFVGEVIQLLEDINGEHCEGFKSEDRDDGVFTVLAEFPVTEDMAQHVQTYVQAIRDKVEGYKLRGATGVQLLVEQRVEHGAAIGVEGQFGTADAILLVTWPDGTSWLDVNDLKFGRGVQVDAEENEQLMLYALGAHAAYGLVAEVTAFSMAIHQPRIGHRSEWECSKDHLFAFAERAHWRAELAQSATQEANSPGFADLYLSPGEKQCRFCKAKATCPALAAKVQEVIGADFEDLVTGKPVENVPAMLPEPNLSAAMKATDLIEQWCKAVRAEVERRLLAGEQVEGYKLVEGRAGPRSWSDAAEVEKTLKTMRLKAEEMYDFTLISPTTAEKLAKAKTIGPKQWPKLQAFIRRSDPKPSVAPVSDKRPALVIAPVADDFVDVSGVHLPETAEDLV